MYIMGMYDMSMYVVTNNILTNSTRQTTSNVYFPIRNLFSDKVT